MNLPAKSLDTFIFFSRQTIYYFLCGSQLKFGFIFVSGPLELLVSAGDHPTIPCRVV